MKRGWQGCAMCLFAPGLPVLWQRPVLFWTLAAVLPAVFAWAWTARRRKGPGSEGGPGV